jgi:hypothetical protein
LSVNYVNYSKFRKFLSANYVGKVFDESTPGQLVVVHGRPVLPLAPELRHAHRVSDLEDALVAVDPVDAAGVRLRLAQQLLDELPEVDVGRGPGVDFTNQLRSGKGCEPGS